MKVYNKFLEMRDNIDYIIYDGGSGGDYLVGSICNNIESYRDPTHDMPRTEDGSGKAINHNITNFWRDHLSSQMNEETMWHMSNIERVQAQNFPITLKDLAKVTETPIPSDKFDNFYAHVGKNEHGKHMTHEEWRQQVHDRFLEYPTDKRLLLNGHYYSDNIRQLFPNSKRIIITYSLWWQAYNAMNLAMKNYIVHRYNRDVIDQWKFDKELKNRLRVQAKKDGFIYEGALRWAGLLATWKERKTDKDEMPMTISYDLNDYDVAKLNNVENIIKAETAQCYTQLTYNHWNHEVRRCMAFDKNLIPVTMKEMIYSNKIADVFGEDDGRIKRSMFEWHWRNLEAHRKHGFNIDKIVNKFIENDGTTRIDNPFLN